MLAGKDCMFKADSNAGCERKGQRTRSEREREQRVPLQVESACPVFCQQERGNRLTQKKGG